MSSGTGPDPGPEREPRASGGRVVPLRQPGSEVMVVPGSATGENSTDNHAAAGSPRSAGAVVGPVLDGELLSDAESAALERRVRAGRSVVVAGRAVGVARRGAVTMRRVATHQRSRAAGKAVLRNALYVPAGAVVVGKRMWDARTSAVYERQMRAAEAAGDWAALAEWEQRRERFKDARHERVMDWIEAPAKLARALVMSAVSVLAVLVGLGVLLAAASKDPAAFLDPFTAVLSFVQWVTIVVGLVWGPLVLAAPWLAVLALWNEGRRRATLPTWVQSPVDSTVGGVVPDERAIVQALRHLGLAPLNKAFKDGWVPQFVSPTGRDGTGWLSQVRLPLGVTVEMIADKKNVLAHNLTRLPIEVWPVEPKNQPGVLEVWVADQGSLSGPAPAWPLLDEGSADFFRGVPFGVSQRGAELTAPLWGCNYMLGGIMGQGKSAATRTIALGAALDPLVELSAFVFAYNADFDPFRPRLSEYVKGDDDEHIAAALAALRRLRTDVSERGKLLEHYGAEKVTRELARTDRRMRPKVIIFDEVHELFEHPAHGPEAADLAVKVMKKARKTAITLIFTTVSPTATSIPKEITRNTSNRVAFAVGDHIANDGILGSGKHKAGVRATSLAPNEDRGTAMTVGFSPKPFELARAYYLALEKDRHIDQVTPVITRAMALIAADGDTVTTHQHTELADVVDPLADIAAVLHGHQRMRTQEVLHALASRNPAHYRHWTFTDLQDALPESAKPYKTKGVMQVSTQRVLDALTERDEHAGDEGDATEGGH